MGKTLGPLLLIFIFFSCSKQKSPVVSSDYQNHTWNVSRLEACSNLNINNKTLDHDNLLNLFSCTSWDKEFPSLFDGIKKTGQNSWNFLFNSFDQKVFSNQASKNNIFRAFKVLDQRDALDDFAYIVNSLNNQNFYKIFNNVLNCADSSKCKGKGSQITEDVISNLRYFFSFDPSAVRSFAHLLNKFITVVERQKLAEDFRESSAKFYNLSTFKPLRFKIFEYLLEIFSRDDLKSEKKALLSFFRGVDRDQRPWLSSWMNGKTSSSTRFLDVILFPSLGYPELVWDLRVLKENATRANPVSCSGLSINLNATLEKSQKLLGTNSQDKFFNDNLDFFNIVLGTKLTCPEFLNLSSNIETLQFIKGKYQEIYREHKVNVVELFDAVLFYLKNPMAYTLSQYIQKINIRKNHKGIHLFDSKLFEVFYLFTRVVFKSSEDFIYQSYEILKEIDPDFYKDLSYSLSSLEKEEQVKLIKSFLILWNTLGSNEKGYLFNFFDSHLDKKTDYISILKFYTTIMETIAPALPIAFDGYNKDGGKKFYGAIRKIANNFSSDEALEDFKKFFSRDYLLRAVEILSAGVSGQEVALAGVSYEKRDKVDQYNLQIELLSSNNKTFECLKVFKSYDYNIVKFLTDRPSVCDRSVGITAEILAEFSTLNDIFEKEYSVDLFDGNGLFNKGNVLESLHLIKNIHNEWGLETTLDKIKYYIDDFKGKELWSETLLFLSAFFESKDTQSKKDYRNRLVKDLYLNFNIKEELDSLEKVSLDFAQFLETRKARVYNFNDKYKCSNFMNEKISPLACSINDKSKREALVKDIQSLTGKLRKSYDSNDNFLKCIIKKASDDRTRSTLSFSQNLSFLHTFTTPDVQVNRTLVEFRDTGKNKTWQRGTNLEKTELVIREIDFKRNYLGVQFLNAAAVTDNFKKTVKAKKRDLSICLRIPGVRCARKMSKSEKRGAKNALAAYDSIGQVANLLHDYEGLTKELLSCLVSSSSNKAQKVQRFPLKDEILKKHNSEILGISSKYNLLSHFGRILVGSVGESNEDLQALISSRVIKRIDNELLKNKVSKNVIDSIDRVVSSLENNKQITRDLLNFIKRLDENKQVQLLSNLGEILYYTTFIDDDKALEKAIRFIEHLTSHYSLYKKALPNLNEDHLINSLEDVLHFLSGINFESNEVYRARLNKAFKVFDILFIENDNEGIGILSKELNSGSVKFVENLINIHKITFRSVELFKDISKFMKFLKKDSISLNYFTSYLALTSKEKICSVDKCLANTHYDEPFRLASNLVLTKRGETRLIDKWLQVITVSKKDEVIEYMTEFLNYIKIDKTKL